MNNLITTIELKKEKVAVTTSRQVAEYFEKRHDHVVRDIEELMKNLAVQKWTTKNEESLDFPKNGEIKYFMLSTYKDSQNRTYKEYKMTHDGFSLLAMGFTGKKAMEFKLAFLEAFNKMREALTAHRFARELTRQSYKDVSSVLKDALGDKAKPYDFSNTANMHNKIVFGCTSKQMKESLGLKKGAHVRDALEAKDLEALTTIEQFDMFLIRTGAEYSERKDECHRFYERHLQRTLEVEELTR